MARAAIAPGPYHRIGSRMSARDLIGKRGEAIAVERLMDFGGGPLSLFDPHPLGEKCSTFDFLVELIEAGPSPPYFLAQVKSTKQGYNSGLMDLKIRLSSIDVVKMARCPIPTYLIGVDEPASRAYIVSIHGQMRKAISRMPTAYPLEHPTLKVLWDEVRDHWRGLGNGPRSSALHF